MQKTMNRQGQVRVLAKVLLASTAAALGLTAAANVNISQTPLHLTATVDPNILFILDDSGSMHWEITPDDYVLPYYVFPRVNNVYGGTDYQNYVVSPRFNATNFNERTTARALRSFALNKSYYNPAVTYQPWRRADGSSYPNAVPTAAFRHPFRTGLGSINLTVTQAFRADWVHRDGGTGAFCSIGCANEELTYYPAVYFRHNGGALWNADNYTQVNIVSTTLTYSGDGRANRTDAGCAAGTCTYAAEIQNFANWYTYYRSRMLAAQAGIGRAFSSQSERMRVGFGAINRPNTTLAEGGFTSDTLITGVRPFSGTNRTDFFQSLYEGVWPPANTPLRRALNDAGRYYSWGDDRGPWGSNPGPTPTSGQLTCRQSFTILMTDGYWNDAAASTSGARANVDGTSGSTITGPNGESYTYSPTTPFTDSHANTLADIAMYYWNRDLRTDLANRVPVSPRNPAFWQHMVTYGVGLGVTGSVNPDTAFGAIGADPAVNVNWAEPVTNPAKIDDLLHASVNSRGGFFSAADPEAFATRLSSVLKDIVDRTSGSSSSAAASSGVAQADALVMTAQFRSTDWSGTVQAREFNADGTVKPTPKWDAEQKLAVRNTDERDIFTLNAAGVPIEFEYANLSTAQRTALGVNPSGAAATTATAENRVNWLRGVENTELRSRLSGGTTPIVQRIGDIIYSDPQLENRRDWGYTNLPAGNERDRYKTFRSGTAYANRPDVLYVGANDGMLHAFHGGTPYVNGPGGTKVMQADGGKELFAYIPSELLLPKLGTSESHAQINELMRKDYSHRYFVDGSPFVSDAYWDGSWKTVLIGTMGAGGRTVFALNVTNPESFSASNVLWEFRYAPVPCVADPTGATGSQACQDVGYGITKPRIVRLRPSVPGGEGRWAAVFGNGYNSAGHKAKLFVVDIKTGRLLYLLSSTLDDGSSALPNGLAPVETTDWPLADLSLSKAYAGDLRGNLWRFDFSGATPTMQRLFTATTASGARQPITARPRIAVRPDFSNQIVVMVGTGSYFRAEDDDAVNAQRQTLYGIFDSSASPVTGVARSSLRQQSITTNTNDVIVGSVTYKADELRYLTANPIQTNDRGWYVDLPSDGERVINEAVFPSGAKRDTVLFSTLIPNPDLCSPGLNGFLMSVSVATGGRFTEPTLDLNGDGNIDNTDTPGSLPPSGIPFGGGETPTNVRKPDVPLDKALPGNPSDSSVGVRNTSGPIGRQSWRQIR